MATARTARTMGPVNQEGTAAAAPDPSKMSPRLGGREYDKFRNSKEERGLSTVAVVRDDGDEIGSDLVMSLRELNVHLKQNNAMMTLLGARLGMDFTKIKF